MKKVFGILFPLVSVLAALAQDSTHPTDYSITQRGPHHRVWSRLSWTTNQTGRLVARTNSYVELTTGLHYQEPGSNEWSESDPSFELTEAGYAVARRCQHQAIISPNLNSADGVIVDLQTPDGQRLRSGIVGLNLFDPVSGRSLQVAAVRDSVGTLVSSNEIVWFDAFDGLNADVRVRNERGQFHQDVLLREKLSANQLAALGFDAETVRMEVWTEFLEAPDPVEQRLVLKTETNAAVRATMVDPDEVDHVLKFGSSMEIGPGSAFIEGEPHKGTRVFKQWYQTGDRRFLIEAIHYSEMLPLLEALPVKSAVLNPGASASGLAANRLPPERAKRSRFDTSKTVKIAKLDRSALPASAPHVVWDYALQNGTHTNYTLRGDTTYYVSGTVILNGTTASTIEGGTVVKFAPYNPGIYLQFDGTVRCLTGPYRPAIFTARDDDTAGQVISDSTGTPSGYYASTALYGPGSPTGDLHHLHIRYAQYAITWYYAASRLSDLQLVNCYYGIGRTYCTAPVHNVLLNNVVQAFWGYAVNYDIEHATVNQCTTLASVYGTYSPGYINLTNCVLANVNSWGSYNQLNANFNGRYNTPSLSQANDFPASVSPFETPVGAGNHYLANATYRDAGTTNTHTNLLATLRITTTHRPMVLSNLTISASTNLVPQVPRDTSLPDLGYHYAVLDFIVDTCVVTNATVTVANGAAIAHYNKAAGIWLKEGSAMVSVGTPLSPNRVVHYTLVQEQPVFIGDTAPDQSLAINSYHQGTPAPNGQYRFTQFVSPGGGSSLVHDTSWAYGNLLVQDCEFWNGWNFFGGNTGSVAIVKNNLFHRAQVYATGSGSTSLAFSNNLVGGGAAGFLNSDAANLWRFHDNAFDNCTVSSYSNPLTNSHNAYINCSTNRLNPTNVNDVVLSSFSYASGPLGDFYHSSTNLLNAGSVTNAGLAGLYHYTTLTNQTKEANSRLDIGLHYVASVDSSGEPLDTDHGGVPDYLEDANGDGSVTNETNWTAGNAADDDLAGVYGSILVPRYLRCEYRQNPLGVETNYGPPRLYWIVTSNRRAQKQSAYRLLVASSEANLNDNKGDVWDSREVPSDQTLHVEYKGNALASGQRMWWKVRSWDAWGSPSPWSTNAFFQMGLLSTNDWTAQWLTTGTDPGDNVSPMYRRAFVQRTNDIKRATAYVSAKGVYELWIDGQRIGPNILAPEWTDYNQRFQYQTYDVTTNLLSANTDGTNHVIGAIVGEGWYHGSVTHDAAGSYTYTNHSSGHGPKQILLQLRIDRNDGSSNILTSGSDWTCNTNGPIRYASIEQGETYDATKLASIANWSTFQYTGEGTVFTSGVATETLMVTQMVPQPTDPIQIVGYVQPIDMWTNRNGGPNANRFVRIFDMGRIIEGWCILSLTNTNQPAGTNIYLRHAESLQLDSNNRQVRGANIDLHSLFGYWGTPDNKKAAQKETYVILQTNTVQQFQPHFTYHGFRFVEVDAPEDIPLAANSLVGCVIRSAMPVTGAFECSHRDVNQLMTNTLWTLEANVYGLPTAAADRNERYGWFADTDVSAQTSAFLLDMAALWTKSLRDIRDEQWKETLNKGYPYYGAYDFTNPSVPGAGQGDVGIESGGIVRPWRLYQNYADARMLCEHYLSASNWLYYLTTNWALNKFNKWIPHADVLNMDYFNSFHVLPHDPAWPTGYAQMNHTIHGLWAYILSADLGANMSKILQTEALAMGDTASASVYGSNSAAYLSTASSLRNYFTNTSNGLVAYNGQNITNVGSGTQGDYATALYFNMIPETQRSNCVYWMLNHANKGILNYNTNWLPSCVNHLSTGTFATGPLMHELTRNGYNAKAYELLTDSSFPSWLYQITNGGPAYSGTIGTNYGAATCWERWNGWVSGSSGGYANTAEGTYNSFNELWNASVGEWIWRTVAGINPDDNNPGFKNVIVYPQPGEGITNCSAAFNSIRGPVLSSWTNGPSAYALSVTVPANTTASVFLVGTTNLANVTESGVAATNTLGLLAAPIVTNGAALFQIGAGSYSFSITY